MIEYEIKKIVDVAKAKFKEIDESSNISSKLLKLTLSNGENVINVIDKDSSIKTTDNSSLIGKKIKLNKDQLDVYNNIIFMGKNSYNLSSQNPILTAKMNIEKDNKLNEFKKVGLFYSNGFEVVIPSAPPLFTNIATNETTKKEIRTVPGNSITQKSHKNVSNNPKISRINSKLNRLKI